MIHRKPPQPSPWLAAKGPKCRVGARQLGDRIDSSAVACLTPNGQKVRVGVLFGPSDRESSVVMSVEQAQAFARSILSICGAARAPGAEGRTGPCPCGGTWGVCIYHGGPQT